MNYNEEEDDEDLILEHELNDKQADFIEAVNFDMTFKGVKTACMLGGVGSGKTIILAIVIKTLFEELPRSKGQFGCATVSSAKRSLTPTLKSAWRDFFNCTEYNPKTGEGELVFWKKPPPDWEDLPFEEPDDWENCITHIRGAVLEFCGYRQDPDAHRGRNDDWGVVDEASRFKKEWRKVFEARIRANVGKFESNLHHLILYMSNPPYDPESDWLWDLEKLASLTPDRCAFIHTCTMDNIDFLPEGYIESKRASMHDIEFDVEVMGKRITRIKNMYYSALNWEKHTDIDEDSYYYPRLPLIASCDFNVAFTSASIWQFVEPELRNNGSVFVKSALTEMSMAESLAVKLDEEWCSHAEKVIYVTGDRNGNSRAASAKKLADGSYETQFSQFVAKLEELGWSVILEPLYFNPFKADVYNFMNDILLENGREEFILRFHPTKSKQLLVSMTYTPVYGDFTKDKSSERRKGVEQETATHLGDTVDYVCYWKKNGSYYSSSSSFEIEFF